MYVEVGSMFCCGVEEIHGLEDTKNVKEFVEAVARSTEGSPAYYVYTARAKFLPIGEAVAKYIHKHKYGKVSRVSKRGVLNANSGNKVHMWVWIPNKRRFDVLKRQEAKKEEEQFNSVTWW